MRTIVVSGLKGGSRYSDSIHLDGRTIVEGRKLGGGPGSEVGSDLDAGAGTFGAGNDVRGSSA